MSFACVPHGRSHVATLEEPKMKSKAGQKWWILPANDNERQEQPIGAWQQTNRGGQ